MCASAWFRQSRIDNPRQLSSLYFSAPLHNTSATLFRARAGTRSNRTPMCDCFAPLSLISTPSITCLAIPQHPPQFALRQPQFLPSLYVAPSLVYRDVLHANRRPTDAETPFENNGCLGTKRLDRRKNPLGWGGVTDRLLPILLYLVEAI